MSGAFLAPRPGDVVRFRSADGSARSMRVTSTSDPRIVWDSRLRLVSGVTPEGQHVGCYLDQLLPGGDQ